MSQFCLPSAGQQRDHSDHQQRDLLNCSIWPDNNRLLWGSIGFEVIYKSGKFPRTIYYITVMTFG
jgi:hypothetical protein